MIVVWFLNQKQNPAYSPPRLFFPDYRQFTKLGVSMLDLQRIRHDTPSVGRRIHLNNAGASPSPNPVLDRMKQYLELEVELGGYRAADASWQDIQAFYSHVAKFINADSPEEIAFAESATHAWQKVFYSLELSANDSIILFENEYVSFYLSVLQQQKRLGFTPIVIGCDENGDIDLEAFKRALGPSVKAVLLGHMPTQSGVLNPAEEIGAIIADHPARYLLDATQTVGQCPIDVSKIQCDALCATGRKFLRGPRGTGFLYVKKEFAESLNPVVLDLGSAHWDSSVSYSLMPGARRFECWEKNFAGLLGLSEAIQYADRLGIDQIWSRVQNLAHQLRKGLGSIRGVNLCDPGTVHGAIVTFSLDKCPCDTVLKALDQQKITVHQTLSQYARLDFDRRGLKEACRASPHYFNLEEDVEAVLDQVAKLVFELG